MSFKFRVSFLRPGRRSKVLARSRKRAVMQACCPKAVVVSAVWWLKSAALTRVARRIHTVCCGRAADSRAAHGICNRRALALPAQRLPFRQPETLGVRQSLFQDRGVAYSWHRWKLQTCAFPEQRLSDHSQSAGASATSRSSSESFSHCISLSQCGRSGCAHINIRPQDVRWVHAFVLQHTRSAAIQSSNIV